jgi:hypothetical protein
LSVLKNMSSSPTHAHPLSASHTYYIPASESCKPIATIKLFKGFRTEAQQATHFQRDTCQRECARVPRCGKLEERTSRHALS